MNIFKYITIITILFCPMLSMGQNLLPNPSFEDTIIWKPAPDTFYYPKAWINATREGFNYLTPHNNSIDARYGAPYNFPGYQEARTGNTYIGMTIYNLYSLGRNRRSRRREYMQAKLNQTLQADSTYCFQIYLSLADSMQFASRGQLGVYFSTDAVYEDHIYHLPYTPQLIVSPDDYVIDQEEWALFSSQYTASGGEEYITIGNFNDTTAFIDTMYVGGGDSEIWMQGTYYYIDDVFLGHCDSLPDTTTSIIENTLKSKFKLYPNPVGEQFYVSYSGQTQLQFQLYNLMGQKIEAAVQEEGNRYRFSVGHLPKGVYLLRINDGERDEIFKLIRE